MSSYTCKLVLASSLLAMAAVFAFGDDVAVTPEQLKQDWLRQLELRFQPTTTSNSAVSPEDDAAGAVDGLKDGKWGFHTQNEDQPWWQVDLQDSMALDRIVLFNRCDGEFAARNNHIQVLLSDDGRAFRKVHQHNGTVFRGHPDDAPLTIPMKGATARYVRLQLPGRNYFHLDEVEVYASDATDNVALNKPATQSSTSQWSARGRPAVTTPLTAASAIVDRGLLLAEGLQQQGVDIVSYEMELKQLGNELAQSSDASSQQERERQYFKARQIVRQLALQNPKLDFDKILFVKRAPAMFPHVSDQYYGWWSRPGGGIYLLENFRSDDSRTRCLTPDWAPGNFLRPDLSYDGQRVLFAYCRHYPHLANVADKTAKDQLPEDSFYHIFEMDLADRAVRQLTFGRYDDFDARYLPNGRIVFLSTRKGTALQTGRASAAATVDNLCPDSYVRCGGGNHRPVAVFTLHSMNESGGDLCAISAFENFEWTPAVSNDGRILYARWDYIDRFNGHFMSLWSTNPDGTNGQLVYGNYTKKPQCIFEARPIPDSHKLIFTATAHHSITGGSLVLLDRTRGTEFDRPLKRLTPEVCFPETEGSPTSYYAHPWPLSEDHFLCSWSDRRLPAHTLMNSDDPRNPPNACGIYLYDSYGNLTLLHRDPAISSVTPIPVRPRQRPPRLPQTVKWDGPQRGSFLVQDIYEGLAGVPRGSIHRLRIVGVPPKVQPHMNKPAVGISREDPGKFVMGTIPVEADGSAYFEIPSGIPVFFQALDDDGLAVQTMRSLTYVQPGQTMACIGCHEHRDSAPLRNAHPLAAMRAPSPLTAGPEGSWPLRFDRLVGTVLEKNCIRCHQPGSEEKHAAQLDLSPAAAYNNLLDFADGDLRKLVFERDESIVGDMPAHKSRLLELLDAPDGHYGVRLCAEDRRRLITWMDTYGHQFGSYSQQQEAELTELKKQFADLFTK